MKALIIYYSYGQNTREVAKYIQNKLQCDLIEIQTVVPYPKDYDTTVHQGQREVNAGFMPEIKDIALDWSNYDTIVLGTPVWWYTYAPAVKTFLSNTNLSKKNLYAFMTNGGWLGHTVEDIQRNAEGAHVMSTLNVLFDGNKLKTSQQAIDEWIAQIQ